MRTSTNALVYWVWIKERHVFGQEVLAGLGLAVGIALLFASHVASASLNGSAQNVSSELLGDMQYQLDARGLGGFDQGLLAEVQRLPGVRVAVPVLEEPVTVIGPAGRRAVDLIGAGSRSALGDGELLKRFRDIPLGRLGGISLPDPVAQQIGVGGAHRRLRLLAGGRIATARFGVQFDENMIGSLVDSPVATGSLAYVQGLTQMHGRITRIFVRASRRDDREVRDGLVRLAAGSLNVEPANFDATLFDVATAPANQSETLFSGISALVGFLFAFSSMLLTLPIRRSLAASLRVNGATRLDIARTLSLDAFVLGAFASLLGLGLGEVLSLVIFRSSPGYLSLAFPVGSHRSVTWASVVIAVGVGMLAAYIGVLASLWRAPSRPAITRTTSARRGTWARSMWLLTGGLSCIAVTTAILIAAPQKAVLGSVFLVLSLLLLSPFVLDAILAAFGRLQARFGSASCRVALAELRSPKTRPRTIAIAAIGAIALFGSVALQGAQSNLQRGLDRSAHDIAETANLWILSPGGSQGVLATTPFRQDPALDLADHPGVQAVGLYRASFLNYRDRRVWVLALPPTASSPLPASQLVDGNLALATRRLRRGGWAVLSQAIADQHHLRIGQAFTLPSPRPITFRLAATSTNLGWSPGAILLSSGDYARAWGSADIGAYTVKLKPGAKTDTVRREMRQALGSASGLTVESAREREQSMRATSRQGLSRLTQLARLVLITAVLAMSTAIGAMIWQRRPRLARMKAQGYGRAVLSRALLCESGLLIGTGCALGAGFGVYGQFLISHALATVTGFPVSFSLDLPATLASLATVTATAVALVGLLGYRAASAPAA
jgi:putative ABC transport system permease protein